jgi:hypothetical protein
MALLRGDDEYAHNIGFWAIDLVIGGESDVVDAMEEVAISE